MEYIEPYYAKVSSLKREVLVSFLYNPNNVCRIEKKGVDVYVRSFDNNKQDEKIGSYEISSRSSLFYPFKRFDRWYALYEQDYDLVVMSLPDMRNIARIENIFIKSVKSLDEIYIPRFLDYIRFIECNYGKSVIPSEILLIDNDIERNKFDKKVDLVEHDWYHADFCFISFYYYTLDSNSMDIIDLSKILEGKLSFKLEKEIPIPEWLKLKQCIDLSEFELEYQKIKSATIKILEL